VKTSSVLFGLSLCCFALGGYLHARPTPAERKAARELAERQERERATQAWEEARRSGAIRVLSEVTRGTVSSAELERALDDIGFDTTRVAVQARVQGAREAAIVARMRADRALDRLPVIRRGDATITQAMLMAGDSLHRAVAHLEYVSRRLPEGDSMVTVAARYGALDAKVERVVGARKAAGAFSADARAHCREVKRNAEDRAWTSEQMRGVRTDAPFYREKAAHLDSLRSSRWEKLCGFHWE
jgi:hypothetical protein